jgi:hypothetical protein
MTCISHSEIGVAMSEEQKTAVKMKQANIRLTAEQEVLLKKYCVERDELTGCDNRCNCQGHIRVCWVENLRGRATHTHTNFEVLDLNFESSVVKFVVGS